MRRSQWPSHLFFVTIIAVSSLLALMVRFGRVTGDEGLYLNASRLIFEGKVLYRDFLFNQMPLLPYAYAPILKVLGLRIEWARILSSILFLASLMQLWVSLRRMYGAPAAAFCLLITGLNLSILFDSGAFKTQALSIFLLSCALLALSKRENSPRRWVLASMCVGLACFERLSLLPILPIFFAWALARREVKDVRTLLACASGGVLFLALSGAMLWLSRGNMVFGALTLHSRYHEQFPSSGLEAQISFWIGFIGNQAAILILLLIASVALLKRLACSTARANLGIEVPAWISYGVITLIHVTRTAPYPIHQTTLFPLALFPIGWWVSTRGPRTVPVMGLTLALCCLQMPFQEFELRFGAAGSLKGMEEAAAYLKSLPSEGRPCLVLDPGLAIMAGVEPVEGFELGEFSYIHDASPEECQRYHLVNYPMILDLITNGPQSVLCLRASDFSAMSDEEYYGEFLSRVQARYANVKTFEGYGQFEEELRIFVKSP